MPRCSGIGVFRHYLTLIRAQLGHVAHSARTARSLRHLRAVCQKSTSILLCRHLSTRPWRARSRGVVVFHAASLVLLIGGLKRASAQASASPQRYKTRAPKRRYGGPPPRLARVASDLSAIGKPAARRAAPTCDRVNFASRFSGTIAFLFICRRYPVSAMVSYLPCLILAAH